MKYWKFLFPLIIINCACQTSQDDDFRRFFTTFQQQVDNEPLMRAFLAGQLAFDSLLIPIRTVEIDSISRRVNDQLESLTHFSTERLSPDLHLYHERTKDFLTLLSKHLHIDQLHRSDPGFYDPRPRLNYLLQKATIPEWLEPLEMLTINYNSATELLLSDRSKGSAAAVKQGTEVFQLLSTEVQKKGQTMEGSAEEKEAFDAQLEKAKLATKSFIGFANSLNFESRDRENPRD